MNKDATTSIPSSASLIQEALEKNLIAALTKLQHTAVEKELLGSSVSLAADAKPESYFVFSLGGYHFMVASGCFCDVFFLGCGLRSFLGLCKTDRNKG